MPNPAKIEKVAQLKQLFEQSGAIFVTDYQGLNVADETILRKNLRENKVNYLVAKNTLLKLAADQAGVGGIRQHLTGPTAVAFTSDDAALAAKILHDSFKDKDLPRMKVFVVDGEVYDGKDIKRLADLPPRDVLLAQVASAVQVPIANVVGAVNGIFQGLLGVIQALADKKKSEGGSESAP
ncbi:MAG: 50S ribosomal protein L10 [Candidatus Zixiibacteriota bacterium]